MIDSVVIMSIMKMAKLERLFLEAADPSLGSSSNNMSLTWSCPDS